VGLLITVSKLQSSTGWYFKATMTTAQYVPLAFDNSVALPQQQLQEHELLMLCRPTHMPDIC
jgi:hypothetical protein